MRFFMMFMMVLALFAAPGAEAREAQKVAMTPPKAETGAGASEVVRGFYRTLTETMKQGSQLGYQGRFDKLEPAIARAFNLEDMMRISYGPAWVRTSPEQKQQLVNAFRTFSIANYANRFKSLNGESFEVKGERPGNSQGERIVETTLKTPDDTVELNYLMRKGAKGWQIVDVFVNGTISEMATRRSEFGSVVRSGGPEALVDTLEQKSQQLSES
jgi:phospholipid transport system substrate-binding protein